MERRTDQEAIEADRPCASEQWVRYPDGQHRQAKVTKIPLRGDHGQFIGVLGIATISRDIVARNRDERILTRRNRVLHAIASINQIMMSHLEESQLMARICEALTEDGHFRMAWIGCVAPDGGHVRPMAGAGVDRDYLARVDIRCDESPQGRGPTGQAIRLRRTVINDGSVSERQAPAGGELALARAGTSSAATPFRVHGRATGVINLYSDEPHAFAPDEVVLLEKLATDLGSALERRAADAALRESEAQFRLLLDSTAEAIYGVDCSGICTFVNPACLQMLGYQREDELVGKNLHALIHHSYPDGRPYPTEQCHVRLSTLQGKPTHVDDEVHFRADGSSFPVEYWSHPMYRGTELAGAVVTFVDITERKQAEQALRESEERFRTLFESVDTVAVQGYTPQGTVTYWNHASEKIYGYHPEEAVGANLLDLIVPAEARPDVTRRWHRMCRTGRSVAPARYLFLHKDGSPVPVYSSHAVAKIPGKTPMLFSLDLDLSELDRTAAALRESEQRYHALFDASGDCILVLRGEHIVDCNAVTVRVLGCARERIVGQSIVRFSSERQPDGHSSAEKAREIIAAALAGQTQIFEWRLSRYDGLAFDTEASLTTVDLGGEAHLIATLRDISERKQAEERIEFLAHHDALTGLPNRVLLRDRFEHAVAFAERGKSHVAVLFLDLDNFKVVNDTLGHAAGDRLLQAVVSRLAECVRDTDTVSRHGGDEFILLLNEIVHPEAVERIAGEVLLRLGESVAIDGHELNMPCSIGISLYPEDGQDFDTLLQKADTAMYNAKDAGRNTYRFFDEEMNRRAQEHLLLQTRLHQALGNGELRLHFQPQLDIGSGRVLGVEALLRWHNPELGEVSPSRFIPVAEECGLIVPIGSWVLEEACRQAQGWRSGGLGDLSVSVNLSALQFRRANLVDSVVTALDKSGLPPQLLELELTESILLQDLDNTLEAVQRLKMLGVRLAIDDFGTGYSSLSYLKRMAVDKLKIDRTFVRDIAADPDDAAIVRAIIQMAQGLRLETVAEGVETDDQLTFLRQAGCQEVQGFLFSRPLCGDALEAFLRSGRDLKPEGMAGTATRQ